MLQLQARISDDDSGVHCGTTDEVRTSFSVPNTPVVEAEVSYHIKDEEGSEEQTKPDDGGESAKARADIDMEKEVEEELNTQQVPNDSHPTDV